MDSAALASVAARYGVQLVLQHGSTVTGAAHPGSDRDLAVLFAGEPDVDNELRLLAELQALSPDREVDVVVLNHAESGEPPPSDYFASSVLLGPFGGLDATLARHIASCAGPCDRIVHEYDELDPQRVFAALESALRDIPVYLAGVESYLERIERRQGG